MYKYNRKWNKINKSTKRGRILRKKLDHVYKHYCFRWPYVSIYNGFRSLTNASGNIKSKLIMREYRNKGAAG